MPVDRGSMVSRKSCWADSEKKRGKRKKRKNQENFRIGCGGLRVARSGSGANVPPRARSRAWNWRGRRLV